MMFHVCFYDDYRCILYQIDNYTLIPPLETKNLKRDFKTIINQIQIIE